MHENTSCKHTLVCPVWSVSFSNPGEKGGGEPKSLRPLFVLLVASVCLCDDAADDYVLAFCRFKLLEQ
jgi:hypothetical protein